MKQQSQFAEVVVEIADRKVDRPFHYDIPSELAGEIRPGVRVLVPFGPRQLKGYVIGLTQQSDVEETKSILAIVKDEPPISLELLKLARWMANYYMCPLVTVLQAFFPRMKSPIKNKEEWCSLEPSATIKDLAEARKRAPKQGQILDQLQKEEGPILVRHLLQVTEAQRQSLLALVKKGVVKIYQRELEEVDNFITEENPPQLTGDQTKVMDALGARLTRPEYEVFLLHGVTGSGKTEVYLRSIAKTIAAGYQAIVLLPEIALTMHLIDKFRRRFGHQVEVLHSDLPLRHRILTLERISRGLVPVVVGTRSAIFAPVPRLGLVIMDEEHETSYQQEVTPKYHAREVAMIRAYLNKAPLILGSATPSLESYHQASQGKFTLLKMGNRVQDQSLPQVVVADLREELKKGNATPFSEVLQNKIQERLSRKEQSILFLNRRGYANFFNCRDCGYVITCKHCDVSLTYYRSKNHLKCHYCNYTEALPSNCVSCGSDRIRPLGSGTEKVESELTRLFPEARILRLDRDTTRKKGIYERTLGLFAKGEADILIGTQMIAKGLDFPRVTLVGVIQADQMLNFPDFRSRERTFQLLTQVAGRAGRGAESGEVIVQTFNPEHPTILAAAAHDYEQFFDQEINLRNILGYPPFRHLIRILVTSPQEQRSQTGAEIIGKIIGGFIKKTEIGILGPAPAPLTKINDIYRWQLILKGADLKQMRKLVGMSLRQTAKEGRLPNGIRISLDIDPLGML